MPDDDDIAAANTVLPTEPSLASSSVTPTPSVIAERYEILALLGVGGMGRVYRARDRRLDEVVALKVLRRELLETPGVVERFRQEVRLARRVTSPNVVRTFDLGEHGDDHFLTMEYLEGQSLAQLLEQGRLAIGRILEIARAACAGVAAAHSAGVLHRDLKPDNVLIARAGRIAVTDFGIARVAATATATQDRFVGTPAYMAPEQVRRGSELGPATDVYALGVILFEMVTGRRPFIGSDIVEVALARLDTPPPDPRRHADVPDALAALIMRCMAQDPASRFASAAHLASALDAIDDRAGPQRTPVALASPNVPHKTSRLVAILPLRATADLADIADGLSEEIVDSLSMTRALRVRPLTSVRGCYRPDADPREIGALLGVDVVVDGSIRRLGEIVRITARAIGVVDGFQLWASRVDTRPENLLSAGDDVARAVAHALTVEIDTPVRSAAADPRATELYLEGKARLRSGWAQGHVAEALVVLENARQLAPDDASLLAAIAMGQARSAFFSKGGSLSQARMLADRAIAIAPGLGEPWLALGVASLYGASVADAGFGFSRAVACAPGLAMAQSFLGAIVLEAGAVDDALAHLEAAIALDDHSSNAMWDAARAHMYSGRDAVAFALLDKIPVHEPMWKMNIVVTIARFHMWRGELYDLDVATLPTNMPEYFEDYASMAFGIHRTRTMDAATKRKVLAHPDVPNPRLRASRSQFMAELLAFVGEHDAALELVGLGVAAGLQDYLWMQRCPLLEPLRARPKFAELAAIVGARAETVLASVRRVRS